MDDTTIVGDRVEILQTQAASGSSSGISWSAVIAGAFIAVAVAIIIIALGSGIGLALASPFSSSPSTGTLTLIGAVWLVIAQGFGYAAGGYVAGRVRRRPAPAHTSEIKFRDGANGLVVWALGVVITSLFLAITAGLVGGAAAGAGIAGSSTNSQPIDYYTDMLLRPAPQPAAAGGSAPSLVPPAATPGSNATNNSAVRDQVRRILVMAVAQASLAPDDRAYLAQIVSAQTGLSPDDAQRRVDTVINQARQNITQAADKARTAAAYLSFWTFMSLLFGAVCATLGGVLGGELRDEFAARFGTVTAAPR